MKKVALIIASLFTAVPALAGPYVNVESNASYTGSDYTNSTTDLHVGYEDGISETVNYYVQGGPAIVAVDGADNDQQFSGKAGLGIDATDNLNIYGEISLLTTEGDADNAWGSKLGAKYNF